MGNTEPQAATDPVLFPIALLSGLDAWKSPVLLSDGSCVLEVMIRQKDHRIIEQYGLEATLLIPWLLPLCHGQGHITSSGCSRSWPWTLPGKENPQLL